MIIFYDTPIGIKLPIQPAMNGPQVVVNVFWEDQRLKWRVRDVVDLGSNTACIMDMGSFREFVDSDLSDYAIVHVRQCGVGEKLNLIDLSEYFESEYHHHGFFLFKADGVDDNGYKGRVLHRAFVWSVDEIESSIGFVNDQTRSQYIDTNWTADGVLNVFKDTDHIIAGTYVKHHGVRGSVNTWDTEELERLKSLVPDLMVVDYTVTRISMDSSCH